MRAGLKNSDKNLKNLIDSLDNDRKQLMQISLHANYRFHLEMGSLDNIQEGITLLKSGWEEHYKISKNINDKKIIDGFAMMLKKIENFERQN